nr:putative proline-rich receptor-like protein kinase PERK11 [Vanessa tameamea]
MMNASYLLLLCVIGVLDALVAPIQHDGKFIKLDLPDDGNEYKFSADKKLDKFGKQIITLTLEPVDDRKDALTSGLNEQSYWKNVASSSNEAQNSKSNRNEFASQINNGNENAYYTSVSDSKESSSSSNSNYNYNEGGFNVNSVPSRSYPAQLLPPKPRPSVYYPSHRYPPQFYPQPAYFPRPIYPDPIPYVQPEFVNIPSIENYKRGFVPTNGNGYLYPPRTFVNQYPVPLALPSKLPIRPVTPVPVNPIDITGKPIIAPISVPRIPQISLPQNAPGSASYIKSVGGSSSGSSYSNNKQDFSSTWNQNVGGSSSVTSK